MSTGARILASFGAIIDSCYLLFSCFDTLVFSYVKKSENSLAHAIATNISLIVRLGRLFSYPGGLFDNVIKYVWFKQNTRAWSTYKDHNRNKHQPFNSMYYHQKSKRQIYFYDQMKIEAEEFYQIFPFF